MVVVDLSVPSVRKVVGLAPPIDTGVDLSKILGGQTKILGENMVKSNKCMDVSQLLEGTCPDCPLKSTPMHIDATKGPWASTPLVIACVTDVAPCGCLATKFDS